MKIINERPHHILCFWKWQELAYDSIHAQSLRGLNQRLKSPDSRVLITMDEDSFCKECPHGETRNKTCHKEFVESLDKKIKFLLGLEEGAIYTCDDLIGRLKSVITPQIRSSLCNSCGWWKKGICQHFPIENQSINQTILTESEKQNATEMFFLI